MPVASAVAVALLALAATAPEPLLRLQDPALLESSGLAVSARHDGLLWTHADGGSVAEVRGVDPAGETVAVTTLAGIDPYDPEAMAITRPAGGGRARLWLGDIGDNRHERTDVSVFRFAEPGLGDRTVEATWFRFTYPDGPHDAEALLVDPRTGRVHIATKGLDDPGLYRAPTRLVAQDVGTNRLERVADVPLLVTDGAFLDDGRFVLRTYSGVHLFERPGDEVASASLPSQPQGESLAVDGDRLLVGSEGERSAVYAVPLPGGADELDAPDAPGEPVAGGSGPTAAPEADGEPGWYREAWFAARAAGLVGALVLVVLVLRRGRR